MTPKTILSGIRLCLLFPVIAILVSCSTDSQTKLASQQWNVGFTKKPIKIDGILDEEAWQKAEMYSMLLADDKTSIGDKLKEESKVFLTWDKKNLYVGVDFIDSDILANGQEDNMPHYKLGDTCEIFVKPLNRLWYWEIWVTPRNKKTTVFWCRRNLVGSAFGEVFNDLEQMQLTDSNSGQIYKLNLNVAAQINGTISNSKDKDLGWSCEIAIPFEDISSPEAIINQEPWLILVARQNYTSKVDKNHRELTMVPKLMESSFDRYEEYAILKLLK